LKLRQDK